METTRTLVLLSGLPPTQSRIALYHDPGAHAPWVVEIDDQAQDEYYDRAAAERYIRCKQAFVAEVGAPA